MFDYLRLALAFPVFLLFLAPPLVLRVLLAAALRVVALVVARVVAVPCGVAVEAALAFLLVSAVVGA